MTTTKKILLVVVAIILVTAIICVSFVLKKDVVIEPESDTTPLIDEPESDTVVEIKYEKFVLTDYLAERLFDIEFDETTDTEDLKKMLSKSIKNGTKVSDFELDEDNNIIAIFSEELVNMWKRNILNSFVKARENGVYVSEDYTKIKIDIEGITMGQLISTINLFDRCLFIQVLEGVPANDTYVDFIVGPEEEPVYKITWPEEEIDFSYSDGKTDIVFQLGPSFEDKYVD